MYLLNSYYIIFYNNMIYSVRIKNVFLNTKYFLLGTLLIVSKIKLIAVRHYFLVVHINYYNPSIF